MRVLVTGITGRIGANLAAALVREGHTVRGLVWDRDPRVEKLRSLDVELQHGSLTEPEEVRRAVAGVEAIYHLGGAFQGGGPFRAEEYLEINVRGTFHVLEAAKAETGLRHLFFASTDAVYEKYIPGGMPEPIREDLTPRRPKGWYALSKAMAEEMCLGYWRTDGLPVTIFRFAYVVGAGEMLEFPHFFLGRMREGRPELEQLWEGEERLVLLRDASGRSYKKQIADVRDIVHGCLSGMGRPEAAGEIVQLAGPRAFTWEEAIPFLSRRLGIPYVEARLSGPPTHYEFDLAKSRRLLGFEPRYDIERMIDDALAFRGGAEIGVLPTD
jgi:nucleoside-diphosphate-sugar epimerase